MKTENIFICLDCGKEFYFDGKIINFTVYCPKCGSCETEFHRHPQNAKIEKGKS